MPSPETQIPNSNSELAMSDKRSRLYDLEDRTFLFAKNCALFCKGLSRTVENLVYIKQLIRSSASVGANYIEANESLGEKDFALHIKISRKEAKESAYWLRLIAETSDSINAENVGQLIQEATELRNILSAVLRNSQKHD